MQMTNAQVALMAAVEKTKGTGSSSTTMHVANAFLAWLREKSAE